MKFVDKAKAWLATAGIRSIGYLGAAVGVAVLFGSGLLPGILLGIFIADNIVTLKELIKKEKAD